MDIPSHIPNSETHDTKTIIDHILKEEIFFRTSKSWWHGGQNVNKRQTKVTAFFDILSSRYLTEEQKQRLIDIAWHKVHHHEHMLIMSCQKERYQHLNKQLLIEHITDLLTEALREPTPRISTTPPAYGQEHRLHDKHHHSKKKHLRQPPSYEE